MRVLVSHFNLTNPDVIYNLTSLTLGPKYRKILPGAIFKYRYRDIVPADIMPITTLA